MAKVELFGSKSCRFTAELREQLEWEETTFIEHDVESDPEALERMLSLTGGQRMVPVLAEDGRVLQIGYHGRGCQV